MKNSFLTVTDQFCGAGGSSEGVKNVSRKINGGVEVMLALNHWKLAIMTHNTNHPNADHDCVDVSATDPRRYRSTDILITSPECTNHSVAKGGDKKSPQYTIYDQMGFTNYEAERSRATMWDVPRFAEYHHYRIIIVENVVDAKKWTLFDSWLNAMDALGYDHKEVYLNSMFFHPTPQSRDRLYIVFWKKGNKAPDLIYQPKACCPHCSKDVKTYQKWKKHSFKWGRYKFQYTYNCIECNKPIKPYYYAAFNCIDWSNIGTQVKARKKPLSKNTIRRIEYGLNKYKDVNPFIILAEHSKSGPMTRNVYEALQTQATRQTMGLVTPPFIIENFKTSTAREITEPIGTQMTAPHYGIITNESWNSFISYFYGSSQASHITDAIGTVSTKDRFVLVNYKKPSVEECYYRMLVPDEVKLAMAFGEQYIILGNSKQKTKQLGNAVTPPVMEWLIEQTVKSLN